jgi:regulator of protease activity HflC (stomatin/prohibitin superfamily)
MAEIRRYPLLRHLRAEASSYVIQLRKGKVRRSGAGLAFWFRPLATSLVEIPLDDRELPFAFQGRSADFQEVMVQGVVTYRVANPELLARRVDFAIDPASGAHLRQPFEKLALLLTQLAQQLAWEHLVQTPLRELLVSGLTVVRERVAAGLGAGSELAALGLEIASVRVSAVSPTAELDKALQTPAREAIQQTADDATFERRARAVEKERAIQENTLQNQIELARREAQLIEQTGANQRQTAVEQAEAERIQVAAATERRRLEAEAEAAAIRSVEGARTEAEAARMGIHRDVAPPVLAALALRELAGKLQRIEHLNLTPDLLGPLVGDLLRSGERELAKRRAGADGPEDPRARG